MPLGASYVGFACLIRARMAASQHAQIPQLPIPPAPPRQWPALRIAAFLVRFRRTLAAPNAAVIPAVAAANHAQPAPANTSAV